MRLAPPVPLCLLLSLGLAAQETPQAAPKARSRPKETGRTEPSRTAPLDPAAELVPVDFFAPGSAPETGARQEPIPDAGQPAPPALPPAVLPEDLPADEGEGVDVAIGASLAPTPRGDSTRLAAPPPRRSLGANPEAGTGICNPLLFRAQAPGTLPLTTLLEPFQGLPVIDGANRPRTDWSYGQVRICGSLEVTPVHVFAHVLAVRWIPSGQYLALSLGSSRNAPLHETVTALVPANTLPNPLPARTLARLRQARARVEVSGHLVYLSPELPTGLLRLGPWGIAVSRLVDIEPGGRLQEIARTPLQEAWSPALPAQDGPAPELTAFPDPGGPFPGIGKPSSPSPTEPLVPGPFKLAAGLPDWPIVGIPEALLLRR